jgi:NADH:ubiquinone oxidoreductase subunit 3 (subunit A)
MIYDSWVLTGFFVCNILLVVMTAVAYVYQWSKENKSQDDG